MGVRVHIFAVGWVMGSAALAQNPPPVPPELIGTWASTQIDCRKPGPSTLTITPSTVLRDNVSGDITGSRIVGRRSVEVEFEYMGPDKRNLGARMFRLSADGKSLFELSGGTVVATRRKCEPATK